MRIIRPSQSEIVARLSRPDEKFGYPEVGATADPRAQAILSGKYDVDRRKFLVGTGRQLFERARLSLMGWRHFEIPWLELHGANAPPTPGQVVATLVPVAGLWFLNPCRVVYTEVPPEPSNIAAFAYGTLVGHAECGEERFVVSFDPITEQVWYELVAFSRPAAFLSRLAYPLARRIQKRFAISSAEALARAAA